MADSRSIFSDSEYFIMNEIADNENVSQRELSKKLGVSVSTINTLMNKMIKEGLIKMNQVSQKQVFYMLTPVGMMEKAAKTVRYLKIHYRAIYETKEKIKDIFIELAKDNDVIYVLKSFDEMGEMISIAVNEFDSVKTHSKLVVIEKIDAIDLKKFKSASLVYMMLNDEIVNDLKKLDNIDLINLSERI